MIRKSLYNMAYFAHSPRLSPQFSPHSISANWVCVALGLQQQQGTIRNCSVRKWGLLRFRLPRENPKSKRNPSGRHHTRQVVAEEIVVLLPRGWVVHPRTIFVVG